MDDEREPSELAASIVGADRPSRSSEGPPPNAAMGPIGLLLYPYRRLLLLPLLLTILGLILLSVFR